MEIQLKTVTPVISLDKQWVKINFADADGHSVDVVTKTNDFRNLLYMLIEFQVQSQIEQALPDATPETGTSSPDHTLLIAKNIDIVRWEQGGCALQLQTTLGAAFQIGLTPEMTDFLKTVLNRPLS